MSSDTAAVAVRPAREDGLARLVGLTLGVRIMTLIGGLRRGPLQAIALAVTVLYGFALGGTAVAALVGLRFADAGTATDVVTVGGALIVLGFLVAPLLFGVDDALDVRRFALIGVPTDRLAVALAVGALASVPSIALIAVAGAQIVTWSRSPTSGLLAAIGAPIIVATCVLGARVASAAASLLLATRRARDLTGVVGILLIVLASPVIALLAAVDWTDGGFDALGGIADAVGWTPIGAVWAMPGADALGDGSASMIRLFEAVAFVVVLALAWRALVGLTLVTPQRVAVAHEFTGIGWFSRLPATPTGAIAARSFTYWARDPRYRISLVIVPVVPLAMFVPLLVVGVPLSDLWLLPVPVAALFLGWFLHNDVSADHTAVWLHVASGTRGVADRIGRILPVLVVGTPLVVLAAIGCAALYGDQRAAPALVGVSVCILLTGLGLSSIMSALFPYPSTRPGDNPFQQPQSAGATGGVVQGASFVVVLLLSAPAFVLGVMSLFSPASRSGWWALLVGVGVGLLVLAAGIAIGARVFSRRGPELLAFAARN